MPARWTRFVLRHRVPVLVAWALLVVAGALASPRLTPLLSNSFDVPGTDSQTARELLRDRFDERPDGTFTVVFRVRHPSRKAVQRAARARVEAAAAAVPDASVGVTRLGGGIVFMDVATPLDLQHAKKVTGTLRDHLGGEPRAYVTGQPAIQHDLDPVFASDLRRAEAFALPLTLLVLAATLGLSLAVLVPFVFAACTIGATLALLWLVAHELSMVAYVRNLVELVGLGLAVDYSLLVVHRYRDEGSIEETMATAGRAVVFSGGTVAVGLGLLLLVPVPFIRSMGVAGLLVPLVSIAAALTLQPVLLSLLGRHVSRPRPAGRFWDGLARRIMARPWAFLALGAAVLVALTIPAFAMRLTPGSLTGLPSSAESVQGYDLLKLGLGAGIVTPTHVVVAPPAAAATARLADLLARDPETLLVGTGRKPPYAGRGAQQLIAANRHEWGDAVTRDYVRRLRGDLIPRARFPAGTTVVAGGAPPQGLDFVDRAYGAFPWVVAGVLLLTFLVLLRAFRSLVLPLKAIVLNALSVGAAYGVLELVFREPVEAWIPIFLFAALFGLSMDYEVFMVSRMREAHDAGERDADAVAHGLERTGRIVTAAAAIMVIAFLGFAAGRIEGLRQFGVGLAAAVALDATLVRAILVPSLMAVLGRWNWWLPGERVEG